MTERERMLSGQLYDAGDETLTAARGRAKRLTWRYHQLDPTDWDSRTQILQELLVGTGFGFADLKGSEANDAFRMKGDSVVTATNHNAGINGGITNGMPVVFRTAVKPTPSIYKEQETVDYIAKQDAPLSIQGRHDPCIVPRAAIVQTCAAALAVGDLMTARYGTAWMERPTSYRREGL